MAGMKHTYLKTRASLMSLQLLSEEAIEGLLKMPLSALENRYDLEGISNQDLGAGIRNRLAERGLINTLIKELWILQRPLNGQARNILIYWSRKFELYNLKALIRGKLNELPYQQIRESLYQLPPLISLPHDQLLRTENIPELLRRLEQTPYQAIARQARQVYEERNESFSLDATIDRQYYTGLLRHARNCDGEHQPALLKLIGTLIDRQNLPWLLRYRFNYHLSAAEAYYLMISSGRHLHADQLKQLVNLEQPGQVLAALPAPFDRILSDDPDLLQVESDMNRWLTRVSRESLRFSPSGVARSLSYLILRELDLKRVFAIIQGRILGLNEQLIREAMELPREPSHV